jgi:hypothetical protein
VTLFLIYALAILAALASVVTRLHFPRLGLALLFILGLVVGALIHSSHFLR